MLSVAILDRVKRRVVPLGCSCSSRVQKGPENACARLRAAKRRNDEQLRVPWLWHKISRRTAPVAYSGCASLLPLTKLRSRCVFGCMTDRDAYVERFPLENLKCIRFSNSNFVSGCLAHVDRIWVMTLVGFPVKSAGAVETALVVISIYQHRVSALRWSCDLGARDRRCESRRERGRGGPRSGW